MDVVELSRAIAAETGGDAPAEVEAELNREKTRGFGQFVVDAATVGAFIVQVVQLAFQINETQKTPAQLIAELQAKAASAVRISDETRRKVIERIVEWLKGSK
jgi:hypothetical protein